MCIYSMAGVRMNTDIAKRASQWLKGPFVVRGIQEPI